MGRGVGSKKRNHVYILLVSVWLVSVKELNFGVCHEKAKWMLDFASRCLFGRIARAMTINVIFQIFKVNIIVQFH
jgi:hypothetical protein